MDRGNLMNPGGYGEVTEKGSPRTCPCCQRSTDSLNQYHLLQWVFLVVFFSVRRETYTSCPACMRQHLLRWGGLQLLTANLVWPFVVFPTMAFRLATTFRKGHMDVQRASASGWVTVLVFLVGLVLAIFAMTFAFSPKLEHVWLVLLPGGVFGVLLAVAWAFKL
jgi:hypothetical protein